MAATQTATTETAAGRLKLAMEARVAELGMQWKHLARRAEVSYEMLRLIRSGERDPSWSTKRRIEDALRWKPGSFDAVADGRPPVALTVDRHEVDAPSPYTDPVEQALWELDGLSQDERREYIAIHREMSAMSVRQRQAYIYRLRAHRHAAGE